MSISLTKTCRVCANSAPRGWTEASSYKCELCEADSRAILTYAALGGSAKEAIATGSSAVRVSSDSRDVRVDHVIRDEIYSSHSSHDSSSYDSGSSDSSSHSSGGSD